jgi:hypothetical protein
MFWPFLFVGAAMVVAGLRILAPWWRSGRQVAKLEFGPKYDRRLGGGMFVVIGVVLVVVSFFG